MVVDWCTGCCSDAHHEKVVPCENLVIEHAIVGQCRQERVVGRVMLRGAEQAQNPQAQ